MEKELFKSTLLEKAKASNNNVQIDNLSERTIDEVVNLFLPSFADDATITDESWTIPIQMVKTMSGQLRHDLSGGINAFKTQYDTESKTAQQKAIADAVAKAKEDWEKSHADQTGSKQTPIKPDPDVAKLVAEEVKKAMGADSEFGKLSKQFSEYLTRQAEKEKADAEANIRHQVRDYLLGRGVEEDDYALEIMLEKLVIGENPDVEALKTKAEKDYEAIYKKMHKSEGARPFTGGNGGANPVGAEAWLKSNERATQAQAASAEARKKLLK